jgi:hypothetical protein
MRSLPVTRPSRRQATGWARLARGCATPRVRWGCQLAGGARLEVSPCRRRSQPLPQRSTTPRAGRCPAWAQQQRTPMSAPQQPQPRSAPAMPWRLRSPRLLFTACAPQCPVPRTLLRWRLQQPMAAQ